MPFSAWMTLLVFVGLLCFGLAKLIDYVWLHCFDIDLNAKPLTPQQEAEVQMSLARYRYKRDARRQARRQGGVAPRSWEQQG